MFFVLSGFLLSYRYYDASLTTWAGLSDYFRRRIVRIFPLLIMVVSGTFLVLYFAGKLHYENPVTEYLLNISLLKGFSDQHKFSGVAQTWSLTVEETFYLLLPGIILLHRRFHWFLTTLILVLVSGYGLYLWGARTQLFLENMPFLAHYTFWGHSWDFFAGFGLFLLFKNNLIPNFQKPFLTCGGIILYGIVLFKMTTTYLVDPDFWDNSLLWSHIVMPLSFATLMAGLIVEDSLLRRFLSLSLLQKLGKSSYAFYLLHLGLLGFFYKWLGWVSYFLFITLVSWLAYRWLEKPIGRFLNKKTNQ